LIKRTIEHTIELTPEELAFEFCRLCDDEQAKFFNEMGKLTDKWEKHFCFQLQYITDSESLTKSGRHIMELIGQYSEKTQEPI